MSEPNMIVVDGAYSISKGNRICLSFAFPVGVTSVDEIKSLGEMLMEFVKEQYSDLILGFFLAKSESPLVFGKGEEVYMIWSFSGTADKKTLAALKKFKIKEVKYE